MIEKSIKTDRGNIYYWVNENNSSNAIVFLHDLTVDLINQINITVN